MTIAFYIFLGIYGGIGLAFIFFSWVMDGNDFFIKNSTANLFLTIIDKILFGIFWLPLLLILILKR